MRFNLEPSELEYVVIDSNFYLSNVFCSACTVDYKTNLMSPSDRCGEDCIQNCKDSNDAILNGNQYTVFIKMKTNDKSKWVKFTSNKVERLTEEEFEKLRTV